MSQVTISGNAGGTGIFTIASPATNTNRTLTLPDATGTFNVSGAAVEVPSGSASTPSIYSTGDANTGMFFPAADTIAFSEGGTEIVRIDSSGNVTFKGGSADLVLNQTSTTRYWQHNKASSEGSGFTYHVFQNAGSGIGSITWNGSGTSYNTTSDYRLKESVQPMIGALAKVAALKPCTYTWKADGSAGEGFIAHELAVVAPQCVAGAKDAVDENGNPVYQGIDTSFLVATLTAAIQELKGIVDQQAARIAALEAK